MIFSGFRPPPQCQWSKGTLCVGKAATSSVETGIINQLLMKSCETLGPKLCPLSLPDRYDVQTVTHENKE